jgi:antitoxin component YwqK of YwqJK toxin-antitoxin module
VRFTEGHFVSWVRGTEVLGGPVAGHFREPVRRLEAGVAALSEGPIIFTLTAYGEDGSVVGGVSRMRDPKARARARRSPGGLVLALKELTPPAAAFTLDAERGDLRPDGDRRAALGLRWLRFCAVADQPAALPPERRGCFQVDPDAERRHGSAHRRYLETRREGESRARAYGARDLDCPAGRIARIAVHGLQQDGEPRVEARCGGHTITWYWDGQKQSETRTEAGKMVGTWRTWHRNGQLQMEQPYQDGKRQGKSLHWNADGVVTMEAHFEVGLATGIWHWYYDNGSPGWRAVYRNGEREDAYVRWHQNGTVYIEGFYVAGQRNGLWQTHDSHGRIERIERWENGKLVEVLEP